MSSADPFRQATLQSRLANFVSPNARAKGADYFAAGRVISFEELGGAVEARVRGAAPYHVFLARDAGGYVATCTCPHFTDHGAICKHIWAVILTADHHGALPPLEGQPWLAPGDERGAERPSDARREDYPAPRAPWQQFLDGVARRARVPESAGPVRSFTHGEFVYVLDLSAARDQSGLIVQTLWRQKRKGGEWGKPQPAALGIADIERLPESIDRDILSTLGGAASTFTSYVAAFPHSQFHLRGPLLSRAIWLIASSRRLFVRPPGAARDELRPITADRGDPWVFELNVDTRPDGSLEITGLLRRGEDVMPVNEPLSVVAEGLLVARGTIAGLDDRGAFAWLTELRRSGPPAFPPDAAPHVVETLARSGVHPDRLPDALRFEVYRGAPRPRVQISRVRQAGPDAEELSARVSFDYGGAIVPADPPASVFDPRTRLLVERDAEAEQAAVQRLQQIGFRAAWTHGTAPGDLLLHASRLGRAVRTLLTEGWHVEAEGGVYRTARTLQVRVSSGIDWFELHGTVDFGDGHTAPIASLLDAARADGMLVLEDGTHGLVPEEWLQRYARFAGFGEVEGNHVRFKPSQTALLDALLEAQPDIDVDQTFARARAELRAFTQIEPLDPPASFRGVLRDYQRDALGWFDFLRRFGFGGCLADDMGLGKTVMVLAMLAGRRRESGRPSLVVVPRSLVFNWMAEARRFTPDLNVLDYTGGDRSEAVLDAHDLVVTTYGTLRRDITRLMAQEFDYVILDEAQAVKNAATASAKAVRLLRGRHRLALSGTPVENHVGELWSLFDFLNPGLLGSSTAFRRASSVQGRAGEDLALVARAVRPFILRRTKDQVAPELPERTEQTLYVELDDKQRTFYDDQLAFYRASLLARVRRDGLSRSKLQVLEALLRLRQAACHPGLVDARRAGDGSAKFDVLVAQLLEVIDEGHKALVFSQFTSLLALLMPRLHTEKVTYEYLDGKTRDREARIARFATDPGCRVFLISLKAGGLGLNLTEAEYVFLLDPWWNPAVEAQAIDRAHRIGQTRHVFAYRLIAKDTVEEKVAELQASKRELADAILSADPALIRNLQVEDLELLLS